MSMKPVSKKKLKRRKFAKLKYRKVGGLNSSDRQGAFLCQQPIQDSGDKVLSSFAGSTHAGLKFRQW